MSHSQLAPTVLRGKVPLAHRGVPDSLRMAPQDGPETVITTPGGMEGRAFAAGSARMLTPAEVIETYGTATDPKDCGVRVVRIVRIVPAPDWVHVGKDTSPDAIEPTSDSEKGK